MAVALVVAVGGAAHAGPQYERALAAYERVEYPEAVRQLELALPSEPLTPTELERAYFILGSALLGDGQTERADRVFRTLIALRPEYRAERDASPKVNEALKRARAAVGEGVPRILPDPAPIAGGAVVAVTAEMAAASLLAPAVEYHVAGEPGATPVTTRLRVRCAGVHCEAKLPAATQAYRLGFLTPEGAFALATSELRVLRAPGTRPAEPRTPVYKKWWLWTVVGAVVVGGVVGTAVGVTLSQRAAHSIDFAIRKDCGGSAICPLWSTP
jgi:hypothetical protein